MTPAGTEPARDAVSPRVAAASAVRVGEPGFVGGRLHWVTTLPERKGTSVLVSGAPLEAPRVESPAWVSVRSSLFDYGAGAWCATPLGTVVLDAASGALGLVRPTSFEPRYDPTADYGRLGDPTGVPGTATVVAVLERTGPARDVALVAIDLERGTLEVLHVAAGFVAEPAVSPDGRRLAWLSWPRRSMPWDAAAVWAASIDVVAGRVALRGARRVDGGPGCSTGQPTWLGDEVLAYVSEAAGWWQPWCCDAGGVVRRLSGRHAEFQRPRWLTCRWLVAAGPDGAIACAFADPDGEHVGVLGPDGALVELDQPCVRVDGLAADASSIGWLGASVAAQGVVCRAAAPCGGVASATIGSVVAGRPYEPSVPVGERFGFTHGATELDGVLWRATSTTGAVGAASPLVVSVHPGPTGATDHSYASVVHLLCANGLAVASIDVSGSTAHGRAYRERLRGNFGVLDVAECAAAAAHLVAAGVARPGSVFIRGASSGGTTALLALGTGAFRGAVAWYPASRLVDDGDGFEAGYLTTLLGPDGASRSPLARAAELAGEVLVVQGADDPIVTPAETDELVSALLAAGVAVELVVLDGEGHGLRTAAGREAALAAELAFYLRATVADGARDARYDAPSPESTRPPELS